MRHHSFMFLSPGFSGVQPASQTLVSTVTRVHDPARSYVLTGSFIRELFQDVRYPRRRRQPSSYPASLHQTRDQKGVGFHPGKPRHPRPASTSSRAISLSSESAPRRKLRSQRAPRDPRRPRRSARHAGVSLLLRPSDRGDRGIYGPRRPYRPRTAVSAASACSSSGAGAGPKLLPPGGRSSSFPLRGQQRGSHRFSRL